MNDLIFRVKYRGRTYKDVTIKSNGVIKFKNSSGEEVNTSGSRCEIQHFTGWTDKNGNKIFDGDIIQEQVETDEGIITARYPVFYNENLNLFCIDTSFTKDKSNFDKMYELNFSELWI